MDAALANALLQRLPEGIVVTDASLTIIEYLGQAERLYGWTRDEVVGRNLRTDFERRYPDGDGDHFIAAMRQGETARVRMQVRLKDGTWGDYDVVALALRDASGDLIGWLSVAREHTASEAASAELRAAHASLAHVVHGANDATWDWDLRSGRVTFNQRWAEMLGRLLADTAPHVGTWAELLHPDDAPRVLAAVEAHVRGETLAHQAEYRIRHADGHWVWVLDRGKVVERAADGTALRMSGAFTDITIRKRTEEQLQAALAENESLVRDLREALLRVKTLAGLLPICMHCKKVRDDAGYWARIEEYLSSHTDASVTHGICPQCLAEHYPGYAE